jgi:magnesium chelatase accessory protein
MSGPPEGSPHRAASRRVRAGPHDWHVQVLGSGPDLLCLHGAGASGHSFHRLAAHLPGYRLILPDLPGQGLSRAGDPRRLGLDEMAADLGRLMGAGGWVPRAIIGHSAGAALALRLAPLLPAPPAALVGINAALSPFEGVAGWLFPRLARAMATASPLAAGAARAMLGPAAVERLIRSTGSTPDAAMLAAYSRLVRLPGHVEGTLAMMAAWRLEPLVADLPRTVPPVLLIAAADDRAVPPAVARRAAARIPRAELALLPRGGHLVHEAAPAAVAGLILPFLARARAG